MNNKRKYFLVLTAYRAAMAAVILIVMLMLDFFAPQAVEKISCAWTQNTDFKKVTQLIAQTAKELMPLDCDK